MPIPMAAPSPLITMTKGVAAFENNPKKTVGVCSITRAIIGMPFQSELLETIWKSLRLGYSTQKESIAFLFASLLPASCRHLGKITL